MKEIIHLDNIVKSYRMGENALTVLKGISLTVEEGESLAILGPSGSGKSTLMNIVGCMDHFDSGTYLLDGTSVGDCSDDELTHIRNQKIGFIFQKYQLIPQYTVLQNVMMPLLVRGMSSRQAEEACPAHHRDAGPDREALPQTPGALRRAAAAGCHRPGAGGQT